MADSKTDEATENTEVFDALIKDLKKAKKASVSQTVKFQDVAPIFFKTTFIEPIFGLEVTPSEDLIFCENEMEFYLWKGTYYETLNDFQLKKILYYFFTEVHPLKTSMSNAKLEEFLRSLPFSTPRQVDMMEEKYLALDDKVIDLDTFKVEKKISRENLTYFHIAVSSTDLNMPTPVFDNFIETSFEGDEELQEFIPTLLGLYLLPPKKSRLAFFLVGEGANGKSVFLDLMSHLIGEKFTSAVSLERLTKSTYAASELIGKKVNIVNEDESQYLSGERFKAMVTGEKTQFEKKFKPAVSLRLNCKFIFATNDAPTFKNINHGLKRRFHIVPFEKVFAEEEQDKFLLEKLKMELPGIVGKAFKAVRKLRETNFIINPPASMQRAKQEFLENSSSALSFFFENCTVTQEEDLHDMSSLYEEYKNWCKQNGNQPFASRTFWKQLLGADKTILRERVKSNSKSLRNVKLNEDYEPIEFD